MWRKKFIPPRAYLPVSFKVVEFGFHTTDQYPFTNGVIEIAGRGALPQQKSMLLALQDSQPDLKTLQFSFVCFETAIHAKTVVELRQQF
jgi:hypothetical protein